VRRLGQYEELAPTEAKAPGAAAVLTSGPSGHGQVPSMGREVLAVRVESAADEVGGCA